MHLLQDGRVSSVLVSLRIISIDARTLIITAFDMSRLAVGAGLAAAGNAHHLGSRMDVNR